jgi:peptidoglycan glycosyltransferase
MDGAASARSRRLRRGLPLLVAAVLAFGLGALIGARPNRADRRTAERYATAWAGGDAGTMYTLLDARSRALRSRAAFAAADRSVRRTATVRTARAGRARRRHDGAIDVPVAISTRAFGRLRAVFTIPVADGAVRWRPTLAFPGLRAGERLTRRTTMPRRAGILARDGTPLARGVNRTSSVAAVASGIVGALGAPRATARVALRERGYPRSARVGTSGLERALESRLAGTPGGELRAGRRLLARTRPHRAAAVRTSIDIGIERAAIDALAGRFGGAAAIDPRTGRILALSGVAFSALQPPGSTFKIVTTAGALKAGLVSPTSTFPIETAAVLSGVELQNANGEACGGTFLRAFADSCNSVFAPLGARLGPRRLVAAAEAFGFNRPLGIAGAATSTIPAAGQIGDDLAVGASSIGQGRVQASALQMALVAATVAAGGRRPAPSLLADGRPRFARVIRPRVVRTLRRLMVEVVRNGTGTAAAIPGVRVAGKTGTAELEDTTPPDGQLPPGETARKLKQTDAWFVAFAPARRPRIAVGVLLVEAGGGGAFAAPAARGMLLAGLRRR